MTNEESYTNSKLAGELRILSASLTTDGAEAVKGKHTQMLWAAASRIEAMNEALSQLAGCKLTESNCASLDVANRRIRNIATRGLGAEKPQ